MQDAALAPGLRKRAFVRFLELVSDHLQKVRLSIVLPLVLLNLDDELSMWVFRVYGIKDLAERAFVNLSFEGKPALEEVLRALCSASLRPFLVPAFLLLRIKRHLASSLFSFEIINN